MDTSSPFFTPSKFRFGQIGPDDCFQTRCTDNAFIKCARCTNTIYCCANIRQQSKNKKRYLNKRKEVTTVNQIIKLFFAFSFILTVGIIVLWQTYYFFDLGFNYSTKRVSRSKIVHAVEDAEKTISRLARVTNAIALLNEVNKRPKTIEMVIAESLGVQDTIWFESINQSSVRDITDFLKSLSGVVMSFEFHNNTVNEIKLDLKKLILNETTPIKLLGQTLFSFDTSKVSIYNVPQIIERSISSLKQLYEISNSTSSEPSQFYDLIDEFTRSIVSVKKTPEGLKVYEKFNAFFNVLENADSFIAYIEKYKQLTSKQYFTKFVKNVESLLRSVSIIKRSLEINAKNRIMEKLRSFHRLINTSVTNVAKRALIGFPRGSTDLEMLLKDFDDEQLKIILNNGRPLTKYAPQYQCPMVKHGGGSVMVWAFFSDTSMGPLKRIVGTMNRYVYEEILENTMRSWARANLGQSWVFQQDNDPKHTSGHVANWFRRRGVDLLEWPSREATDPVQGTNDERGMFPQNPPNFSPRRHSFSVVDSFANQWAPFANQVATVQVDEASQLPLFALIALLATFPNAKFGLIGSSSRSANCQRPERNSRHHLIALLCYYRSQAGLLSSLLDTDPFIATTIDGAQGQEFDVVIVLTTPTRSFRNSSLFEADHRLNVASSRTRHLCLLMVNRSAAWESRVVVRPDAEAEIRPGGQASPG
uniref:DNA2/NAM7 helicase-like C-terminal domain-containing protein n=1 Tax=Caenorhabditis japonica TaxID=281687 RepID=A0A8R1E6X6_CAEJA